MFTLISDNPDGKSNIGKYFWRYSLLLILNSYLLTPSKHLLGQRQ